MIKFNPFYRGFLSEIFFLVVILKLVQNILLCCAPSDPLDTKKGLSMNLGLIRDLILGSLTFCNDVLFKEKKDKIIVMLRSHRPCERRSRMS